MSSRLHPEFRARLQQNWRTGQKHHKMHLVRYWCLGVAAAAVSAAVTVIWAQRAARSPHLAQLSLPARRFYVIQSTLSVGMLTITLSAAGLMAFLLCHKPTSEEAWYLSFETPALAYHFDPVGARWADRRRAQLLS